VKLPIRKQPGKHPTILMQRLSTGEDNARMIVPGQKETSETVSIDQSHHFSDEI